ncbi:DUF397 domain-containing protein [Streptomyces boncukensis]|uniref:DUF397 domain-containing protein n=1 Tax=Streptomyces boncukensis TaxID=2711219 RepID=A0A6G4X8T1_9ACTN|nr:DUF397 domain-containing protein [Streptomyces boncukensis]NGO73653.1 DUF397 domain-containing protein [Streptomyces boncukensis]
MERLAWTKSSFSSDEDAPNCVELARDEGGALRLRESESPSEVLSPSRRSLAGLVRTLKSSGPEE